MKTHRVLNRLNKCANVRYRKNQVLLWFTINSQSKLKKFSILFLTYLPRKTRYEIYQGFMVGFLNWRSQKVSQELFRQKLLFGLEFFSSTVECCPQKRNKKSSQKRCKSPKNCLTVDIARDRSKTLKQEKEKRKTRKSQTAAFLLLLFHIGKFIFC